ncbi:hypothetical protein GOP47_0018979 [Adiantum capillus-veneris]|uniref:RING-type domain-containing protein n=1 Tax=Adiantum capillus-veneris TaxID=13818 RepID=A0A9D4ZA65_ADICA|nr:hypothetical protein GOP47_0018979 [Adiantum capillus-veneris]
MGANHSKEELLYQEVQNGNHDAVKALHREGASLEWVDKEGRTPLILACTRGELLDMAITLLNLGANINVYRSGAYGGFPLHHAAKRGLDKTATLLLSRGANPLAVNDDGHTPLDLARNRGQVTVVRLLEERLCLFSGTLRELSGFSFLESFAPKLVTKKVWAVVLPTKLLSRGTAVYELAIYEAPKVSLWNGVHSSSTHPAGLCNVAQPRTKISLANVDIEEPNFTLVDPVLYVTDRAHKTKYKFYAEKRGDKAQSEKLYKACKGLSLEQNGAACGIPLSSNRADDHAAGHQQGNLSQIHPVSLQPSPSKQPVLQSVSAPSSVCLQSVSTSYNNPVVEPIPEELALAMALDESIRTAAEEGVPLSPTTSHGYDTSQWDGWDGPDESYKGWGAANPEKHLERPSKVGYSGWMAERSPSDNWAATSVEQPIAAPPSAPPLSEVACCITTDDSGGGICVVCWDARAEGACIPCGHLAGCMKCLNEVKLKNWNCPVCRGPIEQVIKVYAV